MEALGFFGLTGFIMACILFERVRRVERLLRENGIRPAWPVSWRTASGKP